MAPDYIICKLLSQRKSTGYSLRSGKKVMLEVPSGKILQEINRISPQMQQKSYA